MSDHTDPTPSATDRGVQPPRRQAAYYGPAPYQGSPRDGNDASYGYGAPTAVAPYYGPGGSGYGAGP